MPGPVSKIRRARKRSGSGLDDTSKLKRDGGGGGPGMKPAKQDIKLKTGVRSRFAPYSKNVTKPQRQTNSKMTTGADRLACKALHRSPRAQPTGHHRDDFHPINRHRRGVAASHVVGREQARQRSTKRVRNKIHSEKEEDDEYEQQAGEGELQVSEASDTELEERSGDDEEDVDEASEEDCWEEDEEDSDANGPGTDTGRPVHLQGTRYLKASGKRYREQGKEGTNNQGEMLCFDGKVIPAEAFRALARIIQNGSVDANTPQISREVTMPSALGGRMSLGSVGTAGDDYEPVLEVHLEMSEDEVAEEQYREKALGYADVLDDHFRALVKQNAGIIAAVDDGSINEAVAQCLESRLGTAALEKYRAWSDSERKFKSQTRQQWDEMITHMDKLTLALVSLASKIEQVKNERLRLISAARKAFEDKLSEQRVEVEGFMAELDKSQRRASKAYKKFTNEEAIENDISMKLDAALQDFRANWRAHAQALAGRKRKIQEEQDEKINEEEEEEEGGVEDEEEMEDD